MAGTTCHSHQGLGRQGEGGTLCLLSTVPRFALTKCTYTSQEAVSLKCRREDQIITGIVWDTGIDNHASPIQAKCPLRLTLEVHAPLRNIIYIYIFFFCARSLITGNKQWSPRVCLGFISVAVRQICLHLSPSLISGERLTSHEVFMRHLGLSAFHYANYLALVSS